MVKRNLYFEKQMKKTILEEKSSFLIFLDF